MVAVLCGVFMLYRSRVSRGFTLVELLVVIGIIAILVGILLPVVSKVRTSGYIADSKNWLGQISGAIERYYTDFHAYPGPIPDNNIADAGFTKSNYTINNFIYAPQISSGAVSAGFDGTTLDSTKITGPENLALGLLGGLTLVQRAALIQVTFDPSQVGLGPMNLNPANPKRYPKYMDALNLSWNTRLPSGLKSGKYIDDAGAANDTAIPEFVDRFPDAMPILYLRCKRGVDPILPSAPSYGATSNSVVTYDKNYNSTTSGSRVGAYDLSQIIGYTGANPPIGVGRTARASDYVPSATAPLPHGLQTVTTSSTSSASMNKADSAYAYPYDAFPYFENPANLRGVGVTKTGSEVELPRQKDGYILIAPGKDRTYGTDDDICNFGDVKP
jgi:prepilin-type N-terminal cleavage/methylation domain-containing protein